MSSRILIPDAGPLLSLAAGDLLWLLQRFSLTLTDVVKEETIDKGQPSGGSVEAKRLFAFYQQHATHIRIVPTQVGALLADERRKNPDYKPPRNTGELSIQSFLIEWQLRRVKPAPIVLFEDHWFLRNGASLAKPCLLLSTQAFLGLAEEMQLIPSAAEARQAIEQTRPDANATFFQKSL